MLRNRRISKMLSLLIIMIMVLGNFTSIVNAQGNQIDSAKVELQKEASEKIQLEVKTDLEKEGQAEVLVYMRDQVDTEMIAKATKAAVSNYMTPYKTKMEVRKGVLEALKDKADLTQVKLLNYLEQEKEKGNVVEYEPYHIVNMVYVKANEEVIENISYMTEVEKIHKNKTYKMDISVNGEDIKPSNTEPEWNILRVGADQVWDLGYDGTGVVVGSLDSGVDWTHPALQDKWRGYDPITGEIDASKSWFDPQYGSSLPEDSDSHGTHVMGTIVGREPDGSNPIGVAPGARWIAARVFDVLGYTTDRILLDAAQWMTNPGGDLTAAPDVVNNSWGGLDGIDDWYRDAVRNWRAAEIFPVFSAGNQRPGEPLPWPGSISCPANYPESYAVAAVNRYDERASFSKLGPSPYDETLIKPNISAPGVNIYSSIPGGYTSGYSGTSMSAPHVSGAVALLLSANASLELEEIEQILADTADPLTDNTYPESPNFGYGYGMVNVFEAVSEIATGTGYIAGRVLKEGEDLEDITIEHEQKITEVYAGSEVEIEARITDDVSVLEAELLVKPAGKSYWFLVPMDRISGDHKDGIYKGSITYDMLIGDSIIYKIRARDYAGEVVVSQDYKIDISFGIVPDEYTQGFEDNALGWTMEGVWEWGPATGVDPVPFEGENLAGTILGGNYSNYADDWMVTPPMDLRDTSLEAASLRFYQWYNMENNYDNGYIYVTDNYGEEWNQVGTITNSSNGWQEVVINLNDYIGSTNPIFVGYRFKSDVSQAREGWYIDNVRLIGHDSEAPQVPADLRVETGMTGIKLSWIPSPDGDISHYNIYRSIISGEEYEKIGETSSNTFLDTEVVANTTYYYVISSEDTSGNESDFTNEVSAIASEVYILYYSDFEEDNGEFITGGTGNLWEWGIPTSGPNGAASGEKLWATILDGNYETRVDAYIESPEIVIPEDKIPYLLFNHWYNTENRYDYGFVEVSNDDGITWEKVTGNFTSSSDGWVNEEIPLTTYRGDTIKIRFNFHSDISVVREGWYIDDVTIVGLNFIPPEQEVITYDDGTNENAVVLNEAGNGLAVRFTPTLSGKLVGADIYLDDDFPEPTANRLGFEIYQINEDGTISRVGETLYVDNLIRGAFNYIDLSDFNFYTAGEDFYVSTMQDSIGDLTPGTGIDNDSAYESRSYLNIAGEMLPMSDEGIAGALMIRAHMDYTQTPPENLEPETGKVRTKLTKISSSKLNKGTTTLKAEEKEKISEPDFRINRNNITLNGYKYEMVSDKEVANTPMARGGGIPADDAVVTILETGRSVRTNPATGEYSMRIPMGDYRLQAEAYGYYPQTVEISVGEDETINQTFILDPKPRGTIQGRIFDRYYGNPASFAEIRVVEDPKVAPVTADEDGNFIIPDILVGSYTLKVIAEGFEPGEFEVEVNADQITEVELGLKRFVGYEDEIIYDDGTAENALVLNEAPNGLAVRFTPSQYGKVKGANIYFWGTDWPSPGGNRIGFAIYDIDEYGRATKVGEPIFIDDIVRGDWNYIDLSSFGFSTERDYFISTIQDKPGTSCPGTGIDESSPHGDRSYMNINGEFQLISSEGINGGLMIRSVMEYLVSTPIITNLEEINYINQDSIIVEGTVAADGKVNAYVNGEKVNSVDSEDLGFAVEVDLPEETNEIMVTAEMDGVETEPSPSVTVVKDQTLPVLEVTKPLDNSKINTEIVHVEGNVTDDIGLAMLLINDKEVEVDEEGNFHERLIVDEGENLITVKAVDLAGNEIIIERTVFVQLEEPTITNILPDEDVELRAGDVLTVSFNAPTGGTGYFRLLLPSLQSNNEIGIPMVEEDGLYTGTWIVPEGMEAENLEIEVIYISEYGFEITGIAEGRLTIVLEDDDPSIPEPAITNIQPENDVELRAGDVLDISFNAPADGEGYYRVLLPFNMSNNIEGIPMTEMSEGLYTGTWTVPEGLVAEGLQIEVVFIGRDNIRLAEIAEGKITVIGDIEDMPANAVIMLDEAFDEKYLDSNPEAQLKFIEYSESGQEIYIKINKNTITNLNGEIVDIDVLPDRIIYYNQYGNIERYSK